MREPRYYSAFTDDFSESAEQNFVLKEDYRYVRKDLLSRCLSAFVFALALLFSCVYCALFLHMRIRSR